MAFSALSMTGKRMFLSDIVKDGPAFVYFIRNGDGVNSQFARQLARILATYPVRKTKFYGIIDANAEHARSWSAEFAPRYDVLMDPTLSWPQLFGIDSSPALMLIGTDGKPVKKWSGFSGYWLKDINKAVAEADGVPVRYIDFSNTPSKTQYGLHYVLKKANG